MKKIKDKISVVYAGRYSESKIPSGPEVTARSVFDEHSGSNNAIFVQYFFDGRKYSVLKKLFGKESKEVNNGIVLRLGFLRIIPELRRRRPVIIHLITFERFAAIFYIYRLFFRVKIIYNSHGIVQHENSELKKLPAFYRFKDKFCERLFLTFSDKIIFTSVNAMDIAEKYYSIDENKAVILPNGASGSFYSHTVKKINSDRIKAVMHVKNSLNYSGIELLKKSLSSINIQLGIYILTNEDLIFPTIDNVSIHIHNMIPAKDLPAYYADKDVFISINKYDTFSISTAEAMASGLIPVVTSQTGISRYIQNGVNGYVFDHFDISGLPEILNTLAAAAPQKKYEICCEAIKTAEELKWDNVYKMYIELYKDITV